MPRDAARKTAAEDTADRLRGAILRGEYPVGTDLPSERELSLRLGISRLTLRAALARLETEGLIRPLHGSGNRVLDFTETGGVELLGHLLAVASEGAGTAERSIALLENLLELRRAVAIEVIGLSAERATPDEIAGLRAHVEYQATLLSNPDAYRRADLHFARLAARTTHNTAISLLANTIARVLEAQPGFAFTFLLDPEAAIAVYRRILALIESRDGHTARAFTRRLLGNFDRGLIARLRALREHHHAEGGA